MRHKKERQAKRKESGRESEKTINKWCSYSYKGKKKALIRMLKGQLKDRASDLQSPLHRGQAPMLRGFHVL